MTNTPRIHDDEIFTHHDQRFHVRIRRDDDMGPPWEEHDGHGIVSDWTTRDKAPGERILIEDHGSRRYYDVAGTIARAQKDGWGCPCSASHDASIAAKHPRTRRAEIAHAVEADFEYLRAWCNDEWEWLYVVVTLVDDDSEHTEHRASLGGIDGDQDEGRYLYQVATELAEEILHTPAVQRETARRIADAYYEMEACQ